MKTRPADEKPEEKQEDSDKIDIDASVDALISAIHARNAKDAKEAIKDIFYILDAQPHEEGEHTEAEPHSYDASKED